MIIKIFGTDYDIKDLQDADKLSDLIQESQVNSVRQIAQTLLTSIIVSSREEPAPELFEGTLDALDGLKI